MVTPDAMGLNLSEPAVALRGTVMDAFTPGLRPGEVRDPRTPAAVRSPHGNPKSISRLG